ncbi:lipase family protein [Paenibacillus azoreducens]|uniref:triacylglycerol lipase n=1 Tax=Paenibacillus azoreducens TaxID=116718 RepID=A0A919YLA0_9BACL|nr:hypothetical protein [Paenibacillus azoreducens]GIO51593.1 hypothetical protein J34TS1_63580 [Paenibacillus azoreducens]
MSFIRDEIYHTLSDKTYSRDIEAHGKFGPNRDWEAVEPEGALLHDTNGSGFDAAVFKNVNTDQVIIAYRGTEPFGRPLWSVLMDYGTDGMDVVGGRAKGLEEFHKAYEKIKDNPWVMSNPSTAQMYYKMESDYQTNQFHQAEELYHAVKKAYPNAQISTTGHSLGGAEAEYVAVRNGLHSISFNAPSIVHLLPDELQEKAKRGVFEKTNVAYVDPGDGIGSGFKEAKRHVGSTYYTYSTYEEANKQYQSSTSYFPMITSQNRSNPLTNFILGPEFHIQYIPVTLPMGNWGAVKKFYNSIWGESRHSLERFVFDQEGNIANQLFTIDGQPFEGSPRLKYYNESVANEELMKEAVKELIQRYGSNWGMFGKVVATAAGVTIQLRPEALKEAGQTINRHVQEFQTELPAAIRSIQHLVETSSSRSLGPIVERLITSLNTFNRWYANGAREIGEYINKKADDFLRADQG